MWIEWRHLTTLIQKVTVNTTGRSSILYFSTRPQEQQVADGEFRKLDLIRSKGLKRQPRKRWEKREVPPPRYKKMSVDQDWPSVWPVARTFHPASVPLPLFQGHVKPNKNNTPPGKFANAELMKITNFLHLTPPAVYRHCEAIKKFCTPWPKGLETEEQLQTHFPLEILTTDYLHSSPTIRDFRARIVTVRIKVAELNLDEHATDKFLRLVGERYDIPTDFFTLVIDCCPMRKQNYDYGMYLLAALYHESRNTDAWEAEKCEADMQKYVWDGSPSQKALATIIAKLVDTSSTNLVTPSYLQPLGGSIVTAENISVVKPVQHYKNATTLLHNQGENSQTVEDYGKAVRTLFNLPPRE